MSEITLDALRADTPLGFLAAVGVLRLATDELSLPTPRLGWPGGAGGPAVLSVDGDLDINGLAGSLYALVEDCRATDRLVPGLDGFPPNTKASSGSDPMRSLSLGDTRDQCRQAWDDPILARWIPAMIAVGSHDDGAVPLSQLLTVGPGTVWVERTMRGLLDEIGDAEVLRHALMSWRRVDSIGAYLDVRADVSAARAHASKGAAAKYGEPGASWLALMSLPMLPSRATPRGRVTVGWRRVPGRTYFRYPVWNHLLPLAAVEVLVDHPAVALATRSSRRDDLANLGVVAVMESERLIAGNYNGPLGEPEDLMPART